METNQQQVLFTGGHPILNVKNVVASLDYYCNTLGFQDVFHWSHEDTPPWTFAQVCRGHFSVMLCQQAQGGPGMWMYLDLASLADLAALHQEYQASAAKIIQPPTDESWNMREMLVEDLDGHTLRIGAPRHHHH
ncbi:MAG TPA: VOC family protein [Ktedonosporobacter sp.]|nr:VOC family protein [Ktedonosporobacter sp.]